MTKLLWTIGLFSLTSIVVAQTGSEGSSGGSAVLVEIGGKKLTLADFEQKRPVGLFQARNAFYQAERKALDEYIDEYLLEQQAQKEKVTVEQLLERHVTSTLPGEPSEEALRVYFEGVDTTETYEAVRDKILDAIRQRRIAKAKSAYVQSLRSAANVGVYLTPPRALPVLRETPQRGMANAPVVIVEYADYECPYCQQGQPDLDKIESEYKGKLSFAYKDVPLPMHPHAQKAAEAAHCAEAQGKFWEYHDLLFVSKQLEVPQLKEQARRLKLDGDSFDKCLDSGEKADFVKTQLAEGQSLGLQGTPSFLINGRFFSGNLNYQELRGIVEEELNASRTKAPSVQ
jgi:protein-disulfide isomerase